MKYPYLFIGMLCLFAKVSNAQTTYPSGVSNCIARWNFSNTGGTLSGLPDASGNSNAGSTYNMTGTSGFRNTSNEAATFNGSTSYATVPHAAMLSPSAITIVALVKPTSFNTAVCQINNIIMKATDYYNTGCWAMNIIDNDGDCNPLGSTELVDFVGPSINTLPFTGTALSVNNWYFLVTSYDGMQLKRYTVQMDASSYNNTITPTSMDLLNVALGTNSNDIRIGQNQNINQPHPFTGAMDEIALFNRVLEDKEVQSVYNYLWGGVTIAQPFTDTFLCPSSTFTLNYTIQNSAAFMPGNLFTVQLSDEYGDFSSATQIGGPSPSTSSILCTMPSTMVATGHYRVRVAGSNPIGYVSPDNGKDIVMGHAPISATIAAAPGNVVGSNVPVTFTADVPVKGTSVTYTWKKNSVTIPAATGATYTGTSGVNFVHNDTIAVFIKVNDVNCVYSDSVLSNKVVMSVGVGIKNINNVNNLKVYPNPNNGSFNITGNAVNDKPLHVEVMNALGQVVYHDTWTPSNKVISNNIKLDAPNGIYTLRAASEAGISTMRFTINK